MDASTRKNWYFVISLEFVKDKVMPDRFHLSKTPGLSRRTLILGGLGSLGAGVTALGGCTQKNPNPLDIPPQIAVPLAPAPFSSPAAYRFETVTVNERGKIIKQEQKQTRYFTELLGEKTLLGITWQKGVILEMVEIPAGEFVMGSPENEPGYKTEVPQRRIKVPRFFMGRFEVTEAQWQTVMGQEPLFPQGNSFPAQSLLWDSAQRFCKVLSQLTGRIYRLPSEVEWEYACRAGTSTAFNLGPTLTTDLANFGDGKRFGEPSFTIPPAPGERLYGVAPVGCFPANAFGLHEMHGNSEEWCADEWRDNYQGASTDVRAWDTGKNQANGVIYRVTRGGSWGSSAPWDCRSASRAMKQQSVGSAGFRVVCSVP
jgi:formylglycine-generating enzyme required for sulfatase activity